MPDSKAAATSEKKENSSILDEDIRKNILSSWTSVSVTKDLMDFDLEPIAKSKKKDFNFQNLDMDFDLGRDFGKISSFEMDMSDLDFSFPPKKNKKSNETTEGDSGRVNFQGKEDRFNFSFDFNSLDNFDLDATLSKAHSLSSKQKGREKLSTGGTDNQVSEMQDNEVMVADIVNKPKRGQALETVTATKLHVVVDGDGTLMTETHPLQSENSGDIILQPGAEISSEKAVHNGREYTEDHPFSAVDQRITQDFDAHSTYTNNLGYDSLMEPLKEDCSSVSRVDINAGGEQSICHNEPVAPETVHEKSPDRVLLQTTEPPEDNSNRKNVMSDIVSSVTHVTSRNGKDKSIHAEEAVGQGSNLERSPKIVQGKISKLSQDCSSGNIIASNTFAAVKESSDGGSDCHGSSVASANKIVHMEVNTQRSPLTKNRDPVVDKSTLVKEKELKVMRSKFLSRLDETDELNHESSVFIEPKSVNMCTLRSDSPSEIREANAREERIGISARADLVSHKKVAKGEYALPRSQGTITTVKQISLHINSSKSMEESSKNESQKGDNPKLTYNMDCTQSLRRISTAKDKLFPLKTIKRSVDLTGLKCSRSIEEKALQSISSTVKEIKSLKGLKHKIHENIASKATCPDFTEKQKPGTPTLKRKQAPTRGKVPETPLKRLSQSPKSSSKNVSHIKIQEQVQHQNNTSSKNTGNHSVDMSRTLTFDTPQEMNSSVFELQPEMGNYGNVEKVESYGKDLDDLCNMLKKKHEEAKELLVRAVINNTNLLLLNHPMHDEKIRSVQKLASHLMAMEIVPHLAMFMLTNSEIKLDKLLVRVLVQVNPRVDTPPFLGGQLMEQ